MPPEAQNTLYHIAEANLHAHWLAALAEIAKSIIQNLDNENLRLQEELKVARINAERERARREELERNLDHQVLEFQSLDGQLKLHLGHLKEENTRLDEVMTVDPPSVKPADVQIQTPPGTMVRMEKYVALIKEHEALKANDRLRETAIQSNVSNKKQQLDDVHGGLQQILDKVNQIWGTSCSVQANKIKPGSRDADGDDQGKEAAKEVQPGNEASRNKTGMGVSGASGGYTTTTTTQHSYRFFSFPAYSFDTIPSRIPRNNQAVTTAPKNTIPFTTISTTLSTPQIPIHSTSIPLLQR